VLLRSVCVCVCVCVCLFDICYDSVEGIEREREMRERVLYRYDSVERRGRFIDRMELER
jgi:hypothetical protein